MNLPASPIEILGRFASLPLPERTLRELLGLIAQSVRVDAIQLGIDLGTGYRRDYFLAHGPEFQALPGEGETTPPFVIMRESRTQREPNPSGLVAAPERIDQRALAVGTSGRRTAPRSGIALLRGPARAAFKSRERRELDRLLPQINSALALAFELECARQRQISTLAMLDHANCGCLLLSRDGEPRQGNRLAFELLELARIRADRRLQLPTRDLQQRFEAALLCAARGEPATLVVPGNPVLALSFHAAPASGGAPAPELILVLRSPRAAARLPQATARHFDLTPAEFRLAAALAEGATLKDCARSWNRSYDTLRSQLKALLAKTGTHRQAELVALLGAFRSAG